jgi:hypothetical protein
MADLDNIGRSLKIYLGKKFDREYWIYGSRINNRLEQYSSLDPILITITNLAYHYKKIEIKSLDNFDSLSEDESKLIDCQLEHIKKVILKT